MEIESESFEKFSEKSKEEKASLDVNPLAEQESKIYKRARADLGVICEEFEDPRERLSEIMKKIEPFFQYIDKKILSNEKIEEIRNNLGSCSSVQDKEEFLNLAMKALKPAIDVRKAHADEFEEAQAKAMNEAGGFTEINRLLSYGKSGPIIHIHAPAGETVGKKLTLYREGMRKLAEIISDDPEVQKITATSLLVAQHPGLFAKAGFKIEEVAEDFKNEHFAGEEREIKMATINREFLQRFLKEK